MKKMFVVAIVLALAACGGKKKDNTMKTTPGSGSAMTGSGDMGGSGAAGSGDAGGGGGGGSADGGGGGGQ
jgi:hypothetical protein